MRIITNKTGLKTEGAGITLNYQPTSEHKDWMTPSERPTTVRKPNFDYESSNSDKKYASFEHGIPWASGMSGTTNMLIYAWQHFNKKEGINFEACFLGIMLFLVYDGGHSMHEPLWAASQVNQQLRLGYDFGKSEDLTSYISNYETFIDMYEGNLKHSIENAFEKSFEKTVDYFNKYSFYQGTGNETNF